MDKQWAGQNLQEQFHYSNPSYIPKWGARTILYWESAAECETAV